MNQPQQKTKTRKVGELTPVIHAFAPSDVIAYGIGELDVVTARCGVIKTSAPFQKPVTEGPPCPMCINVIVARFASEL